MYRKYWDAYPFTTVLAVRVAVIYERKRVRLLDFNIDTANASVGIPIMDNELGLIGSR